MLFFLTFPTASKLRIKEGGEKVIFMGHLLWTRQGANDSYVVVVVVVLFCFILFIITMSPPARYYSPF